LQTDAMDMNGCLAASTWFSLHLQIPLSSTDLLWLLLIIVILVKVISQ